MTEGDLVFKVSRSLGLDDTAGSEELTLLQMWANESVIDVLLRTHTYITKTTVSLSAGVSEYQLPSTLLAIDDGEGSTAAGVGPYDLVPMAEILRVRAASPVGPTRKIIAIEGNLLVVQPTPDTGSSETINFYGVPRPTALVTSPGVSKSAIGAGNDPSSTTYGGIPAEFHRALETYMLWRGAEYDDQQVKRSLDLRQQYLSECKEIRKWRWHRASRHLKGAPAAGYPGSRGPRYGREDVYPPLGR